jgi:hypothetical protein
MAPLSQTRRRILLVLVAVAAVALMALLVVTTARPTARPPLPNPNGYDDFVKASEGVTENISDFPTFDRPSLDALVSTNAEALRLVRLGLTLQCVMPLDAAVTNVDVMVHQLMGMKRLAHLLAAEGRLRELENRPADAARSYVEAIRLGNEMSRGGFLITRLVGIACASIGGHALAQVVPKLNREQARTVLMELEKVDAGRVTWSEVQRNERYFAHHQPGTGFNPILRVVGWWQLRHPLQKAETKHRIIMAHERLLAGELALSCYQSEQGRVAARLDDLVTNYLSRVPQDPFSGRPLIYRAQGTNWLLYSVGPDGVDDGGIPMGVGSTKGDILFDSHW